MAWPKAWKHARGAEQTSSSANWSPRCATSSRRAISPILRCVTAITASRASTSPGAEEGFPPARFLDSFSHLRRNNAYYTIHAGEAGGLASIEEAVQVCAANRIGHGVAIMEDIKRAEGGAAQLGDFAAYVRNERICLEMCPSSNVHTGAAASIPEHPIAVLADLDFRVTVNTDNRLMSATTLTDEFALLSDAFNYSIDQVRWFSRNAAKSAFAPYEMRRSLIDRINQFD